MFDFTQKYVSSTTYVRLAMLTTFPAVVSSYAKLIDSTVIERPNWKKANSEEYNGAFRAALDERKDKMTGVMNRGRPTREALENAADAIREAHHDAMRKTVPIARISRHSVPYWDEELSTLLNKRMRAKEDCRWHRTTQGFIPQDVEREYRTTDNTFKRRIKRKRKQFFSKVLEDSPPTDIFQFRNWSTGTRKYSSEPIVKLDGSKAVAPEEKCEVFLETHFPAPADLPDETPDLLTQRTNEIEWKDITQAECLRALMSTTRNTVPGEDGIPNRALAWTWDVAADEYYMLISKSIKAGYHPNAYHRSISPALQKPGKADYSNSRAWRLVHLLSTMGKWIERVIATRLLYYAMKHSLIPSNQFGAMPGKSTTDAALCLTHDIHAANNHNLITSLVTFDISGYFDNINHNRLLMILRDKGVPLPICKWVQSFVNRRETRIRIDGFTDRARAVRTGCPQGSPVSGVLANYYSAPLLEMFAREDEQDRKENLITIRGHRETPITAGLFVDDGSLYIASNDPTANAEKLQGAFSKVVTWAARNGLKIDMNKVDYICFTRPRKRKIPPIPPITLPTSDAPGETRIYEPQPHIKWLGLIFDSKLSFEQHVQHLASRGAAVAGCLEMLATTKGGLSHRNIQTLYNACVLPVLSYAAPVWWNGKKSQIQKIETIENRCLRTIFPVFNTTPLHAIQAESGIPPLRIWLNYMKQRAAARLSARIDPTNPIHERLPIQLRRENNRCTATSPPLPMRPARRKPGMPNKFRESTIHEITKEIPEKIEKILPSHTIPPWRDDATEKRYAMRMTTNPALKGITKVEAAYEHRTRITQISQENEYIITYTDGSMKEKEQENRTGAGWVVY